MSGNAAAICLHFLASQTGAGTGVSYNADMEMTW